MNPGGWVEVRRADTPRSILAGPSAGAEVNERTVVVCQPTSAALVLGSTQDAVDFSASRCAAAGLDVVRRRSGGGAVVVRPGAQIWIDLFIPRGDPLFDDDVVASFGWVGMAWAEALFAALAALGALGDETAACAGGDDGSRLAVAGVAAGATAWSGILCFAGLGAGEVTLDGRKVVGISQRRARPGAWFHSMALLEFCPGELVSLLERPEPDRLEAAACLEASAAAVPSGVPADALVDGVLSRLPTA